MLRRRASLVVNSRAPRARGQLSRSDASWASEILVLLHVARDLAVQEVVLAAQLLDLLGELLRPRLELRDLGRIGAPRRAAAPGPARSSSWSRFLSCSSARARASRCRSSSTIAALSRATSAPWRCSRLGRVARRRALPPLLRVLPGPAERRLAGGAVALELLDAAARTGDLLLEPRDLRLEPPALDREPLLGAGPLRARPPAPPATPTPPRAVRCWTSSLQRRDLLAEPRRLLRDRLELREPRDLGLRAAASAPAPPGSPRGRPRSRGARPPPRVRAGRAPPGAARRAARRRRAPSRRARARPASPPRRRAPRRARRRDPGSAARPRRARRPSRGTRARPRPPSRRTPSPRRAPARSSSSSAAARLRGPRHLLLERADRARAPPRARPRARRARPVASSMRARRRAASSSAARPRAAASSSRAAMRGAGSSSAPRELRLRARRARRRAR